ncbi:hypothetical protein EVAR_88129_1 [Eumeta japonica]|uniref:Uncharacterized protein n=1 Tax=Eumeta variegata TaxID=151549 RepID=A0A4C1WT26_EUMVA|nr:hypothetical protein EVAR_88129_1 [Eumeta japonica]
MIYSVIQIESWTENRIESQDGTEFEKKTDIETETANGFRIKTETGVELLMSPNERSWRAANGPASAPLADGADVAAGVSGAPAQL